MMAVLVEDHPMTVRQVFYRLVGLGVIVTSEAEYKSTVVRLLGAMRRESEIPFGWIADNTRWMRKPRTYASLTEALQRTAETYRRALWDEQPVYVEVWLEKDALAGILYEETAPWDVPLMVSRGYPSLSYLHAAAETIAVSQKPAYLYYVEDYDPSGLDIARVVEAGIREFAPRADVTFERIAVTPAQIDIYHLPTRPTKRTDSRSKGFDADSVEVDAMPPRDLRGLVGTSITRHLDIDALATLRLVEAEERRLLVRLMRRDVRSG